MARNVLDRDLRVWEAFASTGPYGYPEGSCVVFRCTSDPVLRPRACSIVGDKSDAEATVESATREDLLEMLSGAEPLR